MPALRKTAILPWRIASAGGRWLRGHPNIPAVVLCVPLVAFYVTLNLPHTGTRLNIDLDAYSSSSTVQVTSIHAQADPLDDSDEVHLSLVSVFQCPTDEAVTFRAQVSPAPDAVALGPADIEPINEGVYLHDVACRAGEQRDEVAEVYIDRDVFMPEQSPGRRPFVISIGSFASEARVEFRSKLDHAQFTGLEETVQASSGYAEWSGTGYLWAQGEINDPLATSRNSLISAIISRVLGAVVGAIVANLVTTNATKTEPATRPRRRPPRATTVAGGRLAKKMRRRYPM